MMQIAKLNINSFFFFILFYSVVVLLKMAGNPALFLSYTEIAFPFDILLYRWKIFK